MSQAGRKLGPMVNVVGHATESWLPASRTGHGDGGRPLAVVLSHDRDFRHLLRAFLDDVGLQAHSEEEHAGTVQRLARLSPDLVILDLDPAHEHLDWALLEALREHPGTSDIPVVASSAADWLLQERELPLRREGIPTWTQPFALSDLVDAIRSAFTASTAAS